MATTRAFSEWLDLMSNGTSGHPPDINTAHRIMAMLYQLGAWKRGDLIVDVGAGNGAYAVALANEPVRYVAIEPVPACVEFCKRVFAPYPHLQFHHVDWQNDEYNPGGTVRPEQFNIPVRDGEADLVLFISIFTHLKDVALCRHYLDETHRALRVGGKALVTWFRHPPNALSSGAGRTVFNECDIIEAVKRFKVVFTAGGCTEGFHDQWQMLLEK